LPATNKNKALLKVEDVVQSYKAVTAVNHVSFDVMEGEFVSILGANGAGKTSVMRAVSGLNTIDSGKIYFDGEEVQNHSPESLFRKGLVQVPENRHMIPGLSVRDNLMLGGASRAGRPTKAQLKNDVDMVLDVFPGLNKVINRSAWSLSGGEQQMCALGRAMMGKPKLLLLDEPSQGLAPVVVNDLFRQIMKINQQGMTVLLVEQNAHLALEISDRVYVMQLGKIVYSNDAATARKDDELISSFIGAD
jgi:branched-chain amino acid transport system ATP-binding protein